VQYDDHSCEDRQIIDSIEAGIRAVVLAKPESKMAPKKCCVIRVGTSDDKGHMHYRTESTPSDGNDLDIVICVETKSEWKPEPYAQLIANLTVKRLSNNRSKDPQPIDELFELLNRLRLQGSQDTT
jgi:hypothetical protein